MFDKQNYESVTYRKNVLKEKYKELAKLQMEIYETKEDMKHKCKHPLILIYDVSNDINYTENFKRGCCLVCNEYIKIRYKEYIGYTYESEEYSNYVTKEVIDNARIIDATKFISEEYRNYYMMGENELVVVAKEALDKYISSGKDLNIDKIKKDIKEKLINFYKEREKSLKKIKGNDV